MHTAATPHRPQARLSTSLSTLQVLRDAVRRAEQGRRPGRTEQAERTRLLRLLRQSGPAVLPTLLRALAGESELAADWARSLLADKALEALRPEITRRLDALLADPRPDDRVKARALALQADLLAPLSPSIVLRNPDALLRESVGELLAGLSSSGEIGDAVDLILSQVPQPELRGFVEEVIRHGGPAAQPLLAAMVEDPRTPRELVQLLLGVVRPVGRPEPRPRALTIDVADLVGGRLERALALLQQGRHAEAHRRLVALAEAHPDRPEVQSALGLCCLRLSRPEEALQPLGRAAALEPGVAVHHFNLATAESLAERPGSCYRSLARYLAGTDGTPGAERRQAAAREQLACYEQSAAARYPGLPLDEVLVAEDGFEAALKALRDGHGEQAIAGFQSVLARMPRHVPSWGNLGLAYQASGRPREAARCWRRALQLDPSYGLAREHLLRRETAKTGRLPR